MAEVGEAAQNAYAEHVIRTIKEEEVYLYKYADLEDVRKQIGRFIEDVFSSLGYLTPAEFETAWKMRTKTKQKFAGQISREWPPLRRLSMDAEKRILDSCPRCG
jgi:hypothetical protein